MDLTQFLVSALGEARAKQAARVLGSALEAADPRAAVRKQLRLNGDTLLVGSEPVDLTAFRRTRVVGTGKAVQAMTAGLFDVLGSRIQDGVIIAKHREERENDLPGSIRVLTGGHPVPTAGSVEGAEALAALLQDGAADDLVFCLISGGGSALMSLPQDGTALEEMQELTRMLLASGADIVEMNTLRKHLDGVKGGGLARLAHPARVITLILSDVIGSPLDVIASGPTVADPSTFDQALSILRKYALIERAPGKIVDLLKRGARGEIPETLKPGDVMLKRVTNQVIASNQQAAEAAASQADREGFHTLLLTTHLQGEAQQAGLLLAAILKQIVLAGQPVQSPACLIAGGETTVTLRGTGRGGRNQELALGSARLLDGLPGVALITLATDGEDGPTDAAGAVVTGETPERARTAGLDMQAYLQNNDSYSFFTAAGGLLKPGPTGTNVNDLVFLFAFPSERGNGV